MPGLSFLSKKSFHTSNISNQEKVWLAEQKKATEDAKTKELARQIAQEREEEELDRISGKKRRLDRGIDWMYEGTGGKKEEEEVSKEREEYLLGKEFVPQGGGAAGGDFVAATEGSGGGGVESVVASTTTRAAVDVPPPAASAPNLSMEASVSQGEGNDSSKATGLDRGEDDRVGPPRDLPHDRNEHFRLRHEDPMFYVSQKRKERNEEAEKKRALFERAGVGTVEVKGGVETAGNKEESRSRKRERKEERKKERKRRRHHKERDRGRRVDDQDDGSDKSDRRRAKKKHRKRDRDHRDSGRDRKDSPGRNRRRSRSWDRSGSSDHDREHARHYRHSHRDRHRDRSRSHDGEEERRRYRREDDSREGGKSNGGDRRRHRNRHWSRSRSHSRSHDGDGRRYRDEDRDRGQSRRERSDRDDGWDSRRNRRRSPSEENERDIPKYHDHHRQHDDTVGRASYGRRQRHDVDVDSSRPTTRGEKGEERPQEKPSGYGLQSKHGIEYSSHKSTEEKKQIHDESQLGPDRSLLDAKRMEKHKSRWGPGRSGTRRAMTAEERAEAVRAMQSDATVRDEVLAKAVAEKDGEAKVNESGEEDGHSKSKGKATFLREMTSRTHGMGEDSSRDDNGGGGRGISMATRVARNRHTNQRLSDSFL